LFFVSALLRFKIKFSCTGAVRLTELSFDLFRPKFYGGIMAGFLQKSFGDFWVVFPFSAGRSAYAQSSSNSGSINGTVLDPTGAVVPDATLRSTTQ